jgi:hypothetical protein
VWRIDWKVTAWAALAFFALDLDRSNLSQANTDNFLEDMGLSTNGKGGVHMDLTFNFLLLTSMTDFNLGNTVFKTSFLLAELPSQLVSKKIGQSVLG